MMKLRMALFAALLLALTALPAFAQEGEGSLTLTPIGTYESGIFDEGAAEIAAYDSLNQHVVVVNADAVALDFISIADPANPELVMSVDMSEFGDSANSVAISNAAGLIAVAVEVEEVGANGMVMFFDLDGNSLGSVEAGPLPDMVTFSPDGTLAIVANEGEPSDDYSVDPEGSVTIIDLSDGVDNATTTTAGFGGFEMDDLDESVRIFGPDASIAQDLEPEYVTVSPDGSTAFVSLQENNAIAVIDLMAGEVTRIFGLGFKDYSLEENAIDASNEDGGVNIQTWPVFGMPQADTIATYEVDGQTYIVTANEGDARDYDTYSEEVRIGDEEVVLDEEAFPNADELKMEENLGRLLITNTLGDTDGDGDYDELYNYGARSFSIYTTEGELVFDSGNDFAMNTADLSYFNSNGYDGDFDDRSDDKGAEPEAVTVGTIGERSYAFIGLERTGGIMVYDITDPADASFVTYANNVTPEGDPEAGTAGDLGPEGLVFIPAEMSPNGMDLLVVANEVSGTTTLYEISMGME